MIHFLHTPPSLQILCHILINGIIIFTIPTPLILSSSHPLASHPLCLFHARIGVSVRRLLCLPASALAYVLWQKHSFAVGVRKSMSGGHHGFCRVASPSPRTIYLLLALVRSFEERIVTQESRLFGRLSLLSPSPWERDGVRLFLHQELHNHFSGVGNRGAGAEDGGNAGFVEEVIVLRGDDTTGGNHDIRTAEFLELLDDLRDEGLVTCRKAGDTQYMDVVLHRLFSCLCRSLEQGSHIDRQTLRLSEGRGYALVYILCRA